MHSGHMTFGPIELEEVHGAHNYHPLPVMVSHGEGAWVCDDDGHRYLDFLAAYSALNFGHRHPALVSAAKEQLDRLTLTSRAFHHDLLGPFCSELAALAGKEMVLPMNSGAEGVETALKVARRWGYEVKGVPDGHASIVVMDGNFHGRTISIVSFSGDHVAKAHYGPYTPGFRSVPYGDTDALAAAIDETTVAVLVEPVQGEAGVIVPPHGYLHDVRATLRRARRADDRRRDPVRSRPHRRAPSPASTTRSSPTCTSWARRWVAGSSRSRPSPPTATCSAC